jgi:hypothetical protein
MAPIKLILNGERPMSLNDIYAGVHWTKRKAEADRVHLLVRQAIDPDTCKVADELVDIVVTVYFKNRPLDASNIFAKLYEDALKGWLITDDSPEYVSSVTTRSRIDKTQPRVEVEIVPAE